MNCIFCKIIMGDIPAYKLYEDENILAFLDINPSSVGHTLIVPKKHIVDLMEIDSSAFIEVVNKAKDIANLISSRLNSSGFSIVQNNGSLQEVKHFHLHVIPSYNKNPNLTLEEVYELLKK